MNINTTRDEINRRVFFRTTNPFADMMFRFWQAKRDFPFNNEWEPPCLPDLRAALWREFTRR